MRAILVALLLMGSFAHAADQVPEKPADQEASYCETYEEDCARDNDEDGRPDNEEDDGRGSEEDSGEGSDLYS